MAGTSDQYFTPTFFSLSDQIELHGRVRASDIALIEGDREVTWAEYNAAGNRIGNALQTEGVTRGDSVATLLANGIWAHELLLGTWRAGAVFAPLSPLLTADGVRTMINDCEAKVLFASNAYAELAAAAVEGTSTWLILEGDAFDEFVNSQSDAPTNLRFERHEAAVIIYSSGTTGTPKGIVHSHTSRCRFGQGFAAQFGYNVSSVALSSVPIHSNGAWLSWIPAKWCGARTVILPAFDPDAFIDIINKHRPTHGFIVPAMCGVLLQHPDIESAGLDCFETALTAGAPMPEAMKREMLRLTGNSLFELWGLTEGVATVIRPEEMIERMGSVGRPMLECDIRIIDADDNDITGKGVGEIVGHSSGTMNGYLNRPDANAEMVWKDELGTTFIRTGDIGEFDEDGYLTLRGRAKDMIISGGFNVFPVDIEAVLLEHNAVQDASVVGVPSEKWGETPVGFVIAANAEATEIREWANAKLAKHQRLYDLVLHDGDFPRNTLGKVLKNDLQEIYSESTK